jgi:hypothetical protein
MYLHSSTCLHDIQRDNFTFTLKKAKNQISINCTTYVSLYSLTRKVGFFDYLFNNPVTAVTDNKNIL